MQSKIFTPLQLIGSIAGITLIRTFIENFSNPEPLGGFTSFLLFINYFLFYTVVALSIGFIIGIITKQPIIRSISRTVYYLPIIWVAPIIDIVVSQGACMAYITSTGSSLVTDWLTFFGPLTRCGATLGIRIEILIIIIGIGRYVYKKTQSISRAITGSVLTYTLIFFHAAIPGIIQTFSQNNSLPQIFFETMFSKSLLGTIHTFSQSSFLSRFMEQLAFFMSRIPWIMIALLIPVIAYLDAPQKFKAWLSNTRITRVVYYSVLMLLGMLFALRQFTIPLPVTLPDIFSYVIALSCVGLSCWLGVVINDIEDESIDTYNSNGRPLVQKTLTRGDMRSIGWITGGLLVTGSLLINWNFFILIMIWQCAYSIYSLPPLKMKRHYLTSSLLVGIAGTSFVLAGYFIVAPNQGFSLIPLGAILATWLTLAIISNTKDFKDVPGDRIEHIQTLPVVFGSRKASTILTYTLIAWIILASILFKNSLIGLLALPWIIIDIVIKKRIPEYIRFIIVFIELFLIYFIT